jgi:hypothetical protein
MLMPIVIQTICSGFRSHSVLVWDSPHSLRSQSYCFPVFLFSSQKQQSAPHTHDILAGGVQEDLLSSFNPNAGWKFHWLSWRNRLPWSYQDDPLFLFLKISMFTRGQIYIPRLSAGFFLCFVYSRIMKGCRIIA